SRTRHPTSKRDWSSDVCSSDLARPGYPSGALDAMLAQVTASRGDAAAGAGTLRAIDLGAGTGKLSWALVERGMDVTAVDTSPAKIGSASCRARGLSPVPGPAP